MLGRELLKGRNLYEGTELVRKKKKRKEGGGC